VAKIRPPKTSHDLERLDSGAVRPARPAWLFIGALLRLDFTSALTFDEAVRSQER
jgi:hypothetical protein